MMSKKILSGSSLKIIAIIAMMIDHFGVIVLDEGLITKTNYQAFSDQQFLHLLQFLDICNKIGNLAFPIFCFLLTEGFFHTKNLKKYIMLLGVFAVVSEPIYDFSLNDTFLFLGEQNVLFELLVGLVTLILINQCKIQSMFSSFICIFMCVISYYLRLDGWYYGILLITNFYLLRDRKRLKLMMAVGIIFVCGGDYSILGWLDPNFLVSVTSLLLIGLYNGERGYNTKYFFYFYYPVHLIGLKLFEMFLLGRF